MKKTLYRKYKPNNFSELIGQTYTKKILLNSLKNEMASHAYIFSGPRGIGKTSLARIFSKSLNCLNRVNGDACLNCSNCIIFNSNECIDIIELDAASNNGVSEIRNIIDSTKFIPISFSKKIYIIDEAHMLTNNSWNALLKTLEDPPKDVIFIFATTEISKIPLTIISRCQRFDLEKISNENLKNFIKKIISKENINIDNEAINEIISLSDGSVRDCLSILNQIIQFSDEKITIILIQEIFGLIDINSKIKFINLILMKDIVNILNLINKYELKGINFYKLAFQIIEILLDKLLYIKSKSLENLKILNSSNINHINISSNLILDFIEIFQKGLSQIKNSNNDKFFFELLILNCVSFLNKNNNKEVKMENKDFKKENLDISVDNKIDEIVPKIISNIDKEEIKYSEVKFHDVVVPRKFEKKYNNDYKFIDNSNDKPYKLKEFIIEKKESESNLEEINNNNNSVKEIDDDIILAELDKNLLKNFSEIAFNNNNEIKLKLNNILNSIKSKIPRSPQEAYISNSLKILVASQNGIVFLFEDDLSSLNLNLISDNDDFLVYIKENFGSLYKVIGVSRDQARNFSESVKKLKLSYKSYPDVNIEKLKLKIKKNATTKEIAMEIFGEELD